MGCGLLAAGSNSAHVELATKDVLATPKGVGRFAFHYLRLRYP